MKSIEWKKITVDGVYILFCGRGTKPLKFYLYTYSTSQCKQTTFHVLSSHMGLVARELNSTIWDHESWVSPTQRQSELEEGH